MTFISRFIKSRYVLVLVLFFSLAIQGSSQVVQNLTAGGNNDHNCIFWDPFSSASGYIIYWDTVPNVYPGGQQIALANVIGYSHTGLIAGKTYYYNVVAQVGGQSSGPTSEVSAIPFSEFVAGGNGDGFSMSETCVADLDGVTISPAPANFTVASGIEQNVLFWEPVTNAVSYTVEYSTTSGGAYTSLGTTTNRYFVHAGLTSGTTYYYLVTANFTGLCNGGTSIEENGTPIQDFIAGGDGDGFTMDGTCNSDLDGNSISPVPQNFYVASGIEQNILFWDPVVNAVTYDILSSTTSGGPYNLVATTNNRYYVNTGLAVGTTYYYIITANFTGACAGGNSSEASAAAVADFIAGGNGDGFAFEGTCYADLDGNSISPAPGNFTVAASIEKNILYWEPVPNAVSYSIDFSTTSGGPYTSLASTTDRYYADVSATSANTYFYIVTATFSGSCAGGTTAEASATPVSEFISGGNGDGFTMQTTCNQDLDGNSVSITPTNFTVAASNEQAILYWDPVDNASAYSIYQSTSANGPFNLIGTTTDRWYKNSALQADTTYYYQVQIGFGGSCLGGTTQSVSATPYGEFVKGGDGDGFAYSSSGFFSLLAGPAPVITVIGNSSVCLGDSVTLESSTASTYQWNLNNSAISGAITKNLYPTVSGNYTVTTNGGTSIPVTITVNPKPAAFVGVSQNICAGQSASLGGSAVLGNTYSWLPASSLSDASISNPTATPSVSTTYTLTETITSTGCFKRDSVIINPSILTAPSVFAGRDTMLCAGQSVTLGDIAVSGNTYRWSPSSGLSSDTVSNPLATPSATTSYILTETVKAAGCFKSDTVIVTIHALPVVSIVSSGPNTFCFGDSVVLTSSSASSYLWSNSATTRSIAIYQSGNYTVIVSDSNSCSGTSNPENIQVNPLPSDSVIASGSLNICQGSSVVLSAYATGSYLWSDGSTTQSVTLTQAGTYTVQITDINLCQNTSAVQTVIVGSLPSNNISVLGNLVFCQGDSVILTADPATSYLWSTGETTQSIHVKQQGNYFVDFTGSNSCISRSASIQVVVNPLPSVTITSSGSTSICQGDSVLLSVAAASTYLWSDGSTTQGIAVKQNGNFSVIVTDQNNCTDTSGTTQVVVNSLPSNGINASGSLTFCMGDSVTLSADTNISYLWSNGETTQSVTIKQAGSYNVVVEGSNGCKDKSSSVSIVVNALPQSLITASGPTSFCSGDSVLLTASPIGNYVWSNGETTQSVKITQSGNYSVSISDANTCTGISAPESVNVISLPSAGITPSGPLTFCLGDSVILTVDSNMSYLWSTGETTQSIKITQSGNYDVLVSGTGNCQSSSLNSAVTVNTLPLKTVTALGSLVFCQGDSVILSVDSNASYLWSNGETTQSVKITQSGNYSVVVTNLAGCTDSSSSTAVVVNPLPSVNITASGPTVLCQGDSVTLTSSDGLTYLWSNGETIKSIVIKTAGNYTVKVSDSNGCNSTSTPKNVIVNANPTAGISASGPLTFCQGDSVILTVDPNTNYLWSTGETTQSVKITQSGTYFVSVSAASSCATSSQNVQVLVHTLPNASISSFGPVIFCAGDSVYLSASSTSSIQSWLWSNAVSTQQIYAKTSGNYSVKATDSNGCSITSNSISVTANTLPVATINPSGNQAVCNGDSLLLTSSPSDFYLWSNGETTQSIYVLNPGDYSVLLSDTNSCSANSSIVSLTVNSLPVVSISAGGPLTFCEGNNVVLTSSAATSYQWSSGETTQSIKVTKTGVYGVVIKDVNGCSATSNTMSVTVNPLPVPVITASGPVSFCPGGTVVLSSTPASSYQWNTGANSQTITVNTSGKYYVIVKTVLGCSDTSNTIQVTVNPAALATITPNGSTTFCEKDSVVLTANAGNTYLWSGGETTQSIVVKTSGSYTVNVTSPLGCFASSQPTVVTVNPLPTATISLSGNTTICNGDSVLLTASTGSLYLWSDGSTTQSIYVKKQGNYFVKVSSNLGCTNTSSTVSILINPTPSVTISSSGPLNFCTGEYVTLTSSNAASYVWSNGSTLKSVNASYSGTYTVTIKDNNGCSASASVVVSTYPLPPIPTISQAGNVLTSSSATSYQWNFEGTPIAGATNQSYTATSKGNYTVTIANANGCKNTSDPHYTTIIGIEEIQELSHLTLSPNPFSESFRLEFQLLKSCKTQIILYDVRGKEIAVLSDKQYVPGTHQIEFHEELSAGMYFLKIQIEGKIRMLKIVRSN